VNEAEQSEEPTRRVPTGCTGLASTRLLGTPGSGKTLLGPHPLARGACEGEAGQSRLLVGPGLEPKLEGVEATVDNLVFLRYVGLCSQLHRMLSILKMRESDDGPSLREFSISTLGIDVAETFEPLEVKKKPSRRKKLDRRTPVRKGSRA
jgi:circadian clock protein KaiC